MEKIIDNKASEQTQIEPSTASPALKQDAVFLIVPGAEVEIHPLASALPLLEGEEFEQLKASISGGQQVPVIMHKGVLLDGRNRLNACRALGITVKAVEWQGTGTPEELIIALNLHRRHLTPSQRAALAVKLLPSLEREAAERMEAGKSNPSQKLFQGKLVDIAGKQVGVSGEYVAKAKKIADTAPEAFQGLLNGSVTLAQATKQIVKEETSMQSDQPAPRCCSLTDALAKIIALVPEDKKDKLDDIIEYPIIQIMELVPEASDENLLAIAEDAPAAVRKAIEKFFPDEERAAAEATNA